MWLQHQPRRVERKNPKTPQPRAARLWLFVFALFSTFFFFFFWGRRTCTPLSLSLSFFFRGKAILTTQRGRQNTPDPLPLGENLYVCMCVCATRARSPGPSYKRHASTKHHTAPTTPPGSPEPIAAHPGQQRDDGPIAAATINVSAYRPRSTGHCPSRPTALAAIAAPACLGHPRARGNPVVHDTPHVTRRGSTHRAGRSLPALVENPTRKPPDLTPPQVRSNTFSTAL